jgi:hypothetical protein
MIRAQYIPLHERAWASYDNRIALFRGEKFVWIKPIQPVTYLQPKLENVIFSKIGGFFGVGGDQVITSVRFEKNVYYPGEKIVVDFDCDNSKCD